MTAGPNTPASPAGSTPASPPGQPHLTALVKIPGLVAICAYMLILAVATVVDVVKHHAGLLYLLFPALFITGALGLLLLLRWAWALTLAAIALSSATFFYRFSGSHSFPELMQGLLNLLFFLYLVRTEVREKLR